MGMAIATEDSSVTAVDVPPEIAQNAHAPEFSETGVPAATANDAHANVADDASTANVQKDSDDQISATILIDARISLEDGSVQNLVLRAADRPKEVARKFV